MTFKQIVKHYRKEQNIKDSLKNLKTHFKTHGWPIDLLEHVLHYQIDCGTLYLTMLFEDGYDVTVNKERSKILITKVKK